MLVRFVARDPEKHRTVGTFTMDSVPRQGEVVYIQDEPRIVHAVSWEISADEQRAIVLLRS